MQRHKGTHLHTDTWSVYDKTLLCLGSMGSTRSNTKKKKKSDSNCMNNNKIIATATTAIITVD